LQDDDLDQELAALTEAAEAQSVKSAEIEDQVTSLIHPNDCLKALRAFVEEARKNV